MLIFLLEYLIKPIRTTRVFASPTFLRYAKLITSVDIQLIILQDRFRLNRYEYRPGTSVGQGDRDQMLALKSEEKNIFRNFTL